jgi:hypothetical protein
MDFVLTFIVPKINAITPQTGANGAIDYPTMQLVFATLTGEEFYFKLGQY